MLFKKESIEPRFMYLVVTINSFFKKENIDQDLCIQWFKLTRFLKKKI